MLNLIGENICFVGDRTRFVERSALNIKVIFLKVNASIMALMSSMNLIRFICNKFSLVIQEKPDGCVTAVTSPYFAVSMARIE
jgi:hypothetical protein